MAESRRSFGRHNVVIALMCYLSYCQVALSQELPCQTSHPDCLAVLHSLAIQNSPALQELDIALSELDNRIKTAKTNNQKSILSDLFTPLVRALVDTDNLTRSNSKNAPVTLFNNPWATIATAIGVPLFQTLLGGNAAQQSRQIAISDLETRTAQLKRNRRELEDKVKDEVTRGILNLERLTLLEEQATRRLTTQQQQQTIRTIQYRQGQSSTVNYLSELEKLEGLTMGAELARKERTLELQRITRLVLPSAPTASPHLLPAGTSE